jgi:hypothetical protein
MSGGFLIYHGTMHTGENGNGNGMGNRPRLSEGVCKGGCHRRLLSKDNAPKVIAFEYFEYEVVE